MALPAYDAEAGQPPAARKSRKMLVVGVAMAGVMAVCITLLAVGLWSSQAAQSSELIAQSSSSRSLNELAMHMLRHADTMPEAKMASLLKAWRNNPSTMLSSLDPTSDQVHSSARTEMLVGSIRSNIQMLGASDSKLCAKKDVIIQKFDDLLKKLGGEELALNISLGKMAAEWQAAMTGWLDSESQYRLRIEQSKEAHEGSKFAEQEYEKYREAHKAAKENYETGLKKHDEERKELDDERALIKMILRYIGVLHDVKATAKSIAAGGIDSTKDNATGVSDPYAQTHPSVATLEKTKAQLMAKIKLLSQLALKTGLPGTQTKLAILMPKTSKLAVYKESVEVANILKEMLDDIDTRRKIITKVDEEAKKLLDEIEKKLADWEAKLVALGNAEDKAKSLMDAAKLEREKLNGEKTVLGKSEGEAENAAKIMIPPYEREIYVIVMIKKKILDHCTTGGREDTPQTD